MAHFGGMKFREILIDGTEESLTVFICNLCPLEALANQMSKGGTIPRETIVREVNLVVHPWRSFYATHW